MDVRGTVVSFENNVQVAKNGGGSYPGARLSYRDEAGALKEKGFHNNVFKFNAVLKTQLSNLSPGMQFIMNMEKEGDFWNVKSILPDTGQSSAPTVQQTTSDKSGKAVPYTSPKSTYETPEERAKKQMYIVRQSTLTQAITLLSIGAKTQPKTEDVLNLATRLESHVYGEVFDDGMPINMQDDPID